jgi:hypothetical protein
LILSLAGGGSGAAPSQDPGSSEWGNENKDVDPAIVRFVATRVPISIIGIEALRDHACDQLVPEQIGRRQQQGEVMIRPLDRKDSQTASHAQQRNAFGLGSSS